MMYHPLTILELTKEDLEARRQYAAQQRLLHTLPTQVYRSRRRSVIVASIIVILLLLGIIPVARADGPVSSCYPTAPLTEIRLSNDGGDNSISDHRLDFDGDGTIDVFHAQPQEQTQQLTWRYAPAARLAWQALGNSSVPLTSLRFGDFNGDQKTDIFSIAPSGKWRYAAPGLHGWNSDGMFIDPDQTLLDDLLFGDFDGDGITDMLKVEANHPHLNDYQWRLAQHNRTEWRTIRARDHTLPHRIRIGNFNGNQTTDLFRVIQFNGRWVMEYTEPTLGDFKIYLPTVTK